MKKIIYLFVALCCASGVFAQTKNLPAATIKTLEGQSFDVQELAKSGKITVISFWATWCSPCKKELDLISDLYEDWQKKYKVELVAVSIDDARTAAKVKATVASKAWPYRILHDPNQDFMRAANAPSVPYTLLLDQNGHIVYAHTGYKDGDEVELEEKIKALVH